MARVSLAGLSISPDDLPEHIIPLSREGSRPDWSHDGKRLVYLEPAQQGQAFELEIVTGKVTQLAKGMLPEGVGFYRVLYLANGDYFFSAGPSRGETTMYVLDKSGGGPLYHIDEYLHEGPVLSRQRMKIAWSDEILIKTADIVYSEQGVPSLENVETKIDLKSVVVDPEVAADLEGWNLEAQNFVPPYDDKITLYMRTSKMTASSYVYDLKQKTFKVISAPYHAYNEVEGIFPDGNYTLVESNVWLQKEVKNHKDIDVYLNRLDGPIESRRLTEFQSYEGGSVFKASNPVVSDDCMGFAVMEGFRDARPGTGTGFYYFDLVKAGIRQTLSPKAVPGVIDAERYLGKSGGEVAELAEGDWAVVDLRKGDWLDYNFRVEEAGAYRVTVKAAAKEKARFVFSKFSAGSEELGGVSVFPADNPAEFGEASFVVSLPEDLATYRFGVVEGAVSLQAIRIEKTMGVE